MMRAPPISTLALLVCGLFLNPAVASAEPGSGPRPEFPAIKPAEAAYRRLLAPYADCLVGKANIQVAEFLNAGAGSSEAAASAKRMARSLPGCAAPRGKSSAAPLLLRGAIFEALYRRDFAGAALPPTFGSVTRPRYGGKPSGDATLATMALGIFGLFDCIVRKNPRGVAEMLGHPPESEGEAAAFGRLGPAISECRPRGFRLQFTPSFARPYVSEILYTLIRLEPHSGPGGR
jgi:hypothetical protein